MPLKRFSSAKSNLRLLRTIPPRRSISTIRAHPTNAPHKVVRTYSNPDKTVGLSMNNDFSAPLRDVVDRGKANIISQILKSQRNFMETKQKSRSWMTPLKVLALKHETHESQGIDFANSIKSRIPKSYFEHESISTTRYVALSYVWKRSLHEAKAQHTWQVVNGKSENRNVCKVRDAVIDRVVRYMHKQGIHHLWVDKECIDSNNTQERQQALQCMDLVYCASDDPIAVLSVPIRTNGELTILQRLLKNQMVTETGQSGSCIGLATENYMDGDDTHRMLDLLHRITSDDWWSRAWCFQEAYRAERDMKLLVPHHLGKEVATCSQTFGNLVDCGELVISSSMFRYQATRFILAYIATAKESGKIYDRGTCLEILGRAGDYTLISHHGQILDLVAKGKSTSTLVLNDLQHKNYTVPSDMLNIAANCNVYYRTMNTALIDNYKSSMSIAMLAMWFLNGEIFWNNGTADPGHGQRAWLEDQNVFSHLDSLAFDACPDIGEQSRLTYRRKLRLLRPKLMSKGIETYGHLFHLTRVLELEREIIQPADCTRVLSSIAVRLRSIDPSLSARLERFLAEEYCPESAESERASRHAMSLSANNLIARLRERPYLAFGVLANRDDGFTCGEVDAGIFAVDSPDLPAQTSFVFTSWQQGSRGAPWYKNQPEEDKYVSLKVSVSEDSMDTASPLLHTEAWVDGLCFYEGATQHPYTFPWPKYFYP